MFRFHDLINYVKSTDNTRLFLTKIQIIAIYVIVIRILQNTSQNSKKKKLRKHLDRLIDLSMQIVSKSVEKTNTWNHLENFKQWILLFTPWWNEENGEAWMHFSRHIGHRIITPCTEPRKFAASCDLLPP